MPLELEVLTFASFATAIDQRIKIRLQPDAKASLAVSICYSLCLA